MASAPQPQLPLFYKDLLPLNSNEHGDWKVSPFDNADFLAETHAIPLTVDEFVDAQRDYPIVFTAGDNPLPIALMGLNEGVNTYIGDDGKLVADVYVPAYVRRYPFILAKLQQDSDDMSLCFDPTTGVVGANKEGQALFDGGDPTEYTTNVLEFCKNFEEAGQRTKAFLEELKKLDILMDGEIAITRSDAPDTPFVYRGFRMVDEKKLRELPTETVETLNKNGMGMLIHAHMFSLNLMRKLFERQSAQGKVPAPNANGAAVPTAS
ncbi:SapC family protein [Erythrobacter crassostreae]|uniref:SapC family protein n=1 Tax=Erythrobacter crassostreae TaxID=2828328 RepID=A0A9X1JQG0_9SPHN|nr:SapC family protein [Erythrobacter crassostrea]MBV7260362.1 SapC family protein [Erythrobacter crassostrea]